MFLSIRKYLKRSILYQLDTQLSPLNSSNWKNTTLVFAPHQDDETLGCGGLIALQRASGVNVKIIFMTDGGASHAHLIDSEVLCAMRHREAVAAAQTLGVAEQDVIFLSFPDGQLSSHFSGAIAAVKTILKREHPSQIFIPYYREPSFIPDHRATNQIVISAARQLRLPLDVYEYPIWFWSYWPWTRLSWLKFPWRERIKITIENISILLQFGLNPWREFACFVDISNCLDQKRRALTCHQTQMERIDERTEWLTLSDIADGEWLDYFFQPREIFYRHTLTYNKD